MKRASGWFDSGHNDDPLWKQGLRDGVAVGKAPAQDTPSLLPAGQSAMVVTWPATRAVDSGPMWYCVLSRQSGEWTPAEQRRASLTLRRMQAAWDSPVESGVGRLLLGGDGRLIHADAVAADLLGDQVAKGTAWIEELRKVIQQRWGKVTDQRAYDVALKSLAGGSLDGALWARLMHRPALNGAGGFDVLEIRSLDEDDVPPVGPVEDARIATALGYITDHYAESPGLKDVAAVVDSSPFHFHRLFSRAVGLSPKHYLLRTQLQMAKWMLRAGRLPVGDVASAAGFASHGHFTATFHRLVGESPSDYRERFYQAQGLV